MVHVALIYETRRKKAMVQVVEWIEDALASMGVDAEVGKPDQLGAMNHDAYFIGSSVYGGKVVPRILEFIQKYKEELASKPVAAFMVCKETKHPEEQMEQVLDALPAKPIGQQFFEGYILLEKDFDRQRTKAEAWVTEMIAKIK
ncbi:hypothetical protein EU538_09425 [Candidatus Thorarchaeota archaeon]|nr:MAG: hypothetical protein EU538_09425 [Candidatus Thorarchaeota archaeon]